MSNGPRANLGRQNVKKDVTKGVNKPRPKSNENASVVKRMLSTDQVQNINDKLSHGPTRRNQDSGVYLHQERAFMYNQVGRNKIMRTAFSVMDRLDPKSMLTKDKRAQLSYQAQELAPYHARAYTKNKDATDLESLGTKLKIGSGAANAVDTAATGLMFANPAAGAATKAVAKGASIGLGAASAAAYERASHAYAANAKKHDDGSAMGNLDSQLSSVKSSMTRNRRDETIISTGMKAGSMAAGFGLDVAMEGAAMGKQFVSHTGRGIIKDQLNSLATEKSVGKQKADKSEAVNIMMHQQAREPKDFLRERMDSGGRLVTGTDVGQLKRQNGAIDVKPGTLDVKAARKAAYKKFGAPPKGRAIVKP